MLSPAKVGIDERLADLAEHFSVYMDAFDKL